QAEQEAETGEADDGAKTDQAGDGGIDGQLTGHVGDEAAAHGRSGEETPEPRDGPEVPEAGQHGEERDPRLPAHVDEDALPASEGPRHEGDRGGIDVLPARPLVVEGVNALPALERDPDEEPRDVPDDLVEPSGPEEGVVARLVEEREPLDQGDTEEHLASQPGRDAVTTRQEDRDARQGDAHPAKGEPGPVSRSQVHQVAGPQRPSHVPPRAATDVPTERIEKLPGYVGGRRRPP